MHVAITGSSGLVGTALTARLRSEGHHVVRVVRAAAGGPGTLHWDPTTGAIDAAGLEGMDAVVHLAGAGIGDRRWTDARKAEVLGSRVQGTTLLATTLAALDRKPSVLVSGSAVGWYGDRGDELLTEASPPPAQADFTSEVCREWEAATAPAAEAGIRTVLLRTGIVLAAHGGTLAKLLLPFKLGLGGRQGSGRQYMSWVSIDDEVGAIVHAITDPSLAGPVNATGPVPVTNAEFASTLGRVLHRPTVLPTPTLPLELVYGKEMVRHLLLAGQRVVPARLEGAGYVFAHPTVEDALRAVVHRPI
jgi:uncharacterized protein (TIGR01777 family)